MSIESPYLTVREFAQLLGVSPRAVYGQIWQGKLPHIKFGGIYRIHRDTLLVMQEDARRTTRDYRKRAASEDQAA